MAAVSTATVREVWASEGKCPLCLQGFEDGEFAVVLHCGGGAHVVCGGCHSGWAARTTRSDGADVCPKCESLFYTATLVVCRNFNRGTSVDTAIVIDSEAPQSVNDGRGVSEGTAIELKDDDVMEGVEEEVVMEDVPSATSQHPGQALSEASDVSEGNRVCNYDLVRVIAGTRYENNFVKQMIRLMPEVMDKRVVFQIPPPMIPRRQGGVSLMPNPDCMNGIKMWVAEELTTITESMYDNIFDFIDTIDDEYDKKVEMIWTIQPIPRDQFTHVMCVTYPSEPDDVEEDEDTDDEDDDEDSK